MLLLKYRHILLNFKTSNVAIYDENEDDHKIVDFEIVEEDTDILKTKVKVIDIF